MNKSLIVAVAGSQLVSEAEALAMLTEAKASGKFIGTLKANLIKIQVAAGKAEADAKRIANKICNDVQAAYHVGENNLTEAINATTAFIKAGNTFEGTSKTGRPQFKKLTKAAAETSAAIAIAMAQQQQTLLAIKSSGKTIDIDEQGNVVGREKAA